MLPPGRRDFYNLRSNLGLTDREKADLITFLRAL